MDLDPTEAGRLKRDGRDLGHSLRQIVEGGLLHDQQDTHRGPRRARGRLLYVSRQLGHSSISITADVYAKWLKPTNKAAADSLVTDAWTAAARA